MDYYGYGRMEWIRSSVSGGWWWEGLLIQQWHSEKRMMKDKIGGMKVYGGNSGWKKE